MEEEHDFDCASVQTCHTQDVKRVLFHPIKDICVSSSYDNSVRFYQEKGDDWDNFCCLEGHESTVWGLSFNQDGSRLASCSDDKTVRVWAAQDQQFLSWKLVCTLSGFNDRPIYDVSWSKGSTNLLATCSGDNTINVFKQDSYSGDQLTCMTQVCKASHDSDVNTIEFNSVEERLVASGSDDGTIKVWMVKEFD